MHTHMAKKKPTPPPEPGEGDEGKAKKYTVLIDADLVKRIRFLAADADVSPASWINNQLRAAVNAEWPRIRAQLDSDD